MDASSPLANSIAFRTFFGGPSAESQTQRPDDENRQNPDRESKPHIVSSVNSVPQWSRYKKRGDKKSHHNNQRFSDTAPPRGGDRM
jgi:hypothetical protein